TYSWQYIVSNLGWGLGYFGMPHILVRFMSIKSSDMIKKSRIIATIWVAITLFASVCVGVLGYVYSVKSGLLLEGAASETIFMVLVQKLFPGFIAGILLCAIVAAIMSTSDSQMLVTASAVSNDIYKTVFKKNATEKELLLLSKFAVIAVAVIAYLLAKNPDTSVMKLVSYAWAGLGAAFGPTMLLSLFWKRMTMSGAIAGLVSGGVGVLVWNTFLTSSSPLFGDKFTIVDTGLYELVPAFVLSLVCIVVFSLLSKKPDKKICDDFDRVSTIEV
ncbi:MAG: sodium:proline symporter, partial [Lachnospirales bacterium]